MMAHWPSSASGRHGSSTCSALSWIRSSEMRGVSSGNAKAETASQSPRARSTVSCKVRRGWVAGEVSSPDVR